VNTLPDGTFVYVETQKSWYWTDLASNAYRRVVQPNEAWMAQTAWYVDSATGSDENSGAIGFPLHTLSELRNRLPAINRDTVVTIAAGSAFGANDWLGWSLQTFSGVQAGAPTMTFNGVPSVGANMVVASSSDEAGNDAPLIDAGGVISIGQILQATSGPSTGATAVVVAFIGGNQYRTSPWSILGFTRVAPPGPGDTVAKLTLPSVARYNCSNSMGSILITNLAIGSIFSMAVSQSIIFRTCILSGLIIGFNVLGYGFQGCSFNAVTGFQFQNFKGVFNACGIVSNAASMLFEGGVSLFFTDTVLQQIGAGIPIVSNNAVMEVTSLGIFNSASSSIRVVRGGVLRVRGTLYGKNNATGTDVGTNGHVVVNGGATPTLAATGFELQLDAGANAIPPLTPGAAVPANWPSQSINTWAKWSAAPFNGQAMSYASGASINREQ
jgi:hypothetical protein